MNTTEIHEALLNDDFTAPLFGGVYPADQLPLKITRPSLFVANTQGSRFPGDHWVAFFFDKHGPAEYFDSYGLKPYVKSHLDFIQRNSLQWVYNAQELQALGSTVCGQYCVIFLMSRARGCSMHDFISDFSPQNFHLNDKTVSLLYKNYVNPRRRSCISAHPCTQCCTVRM